MTIGSYLNSDKRAAALIQFAVRNSHGLGEHATNAVAVYHWRDDYGVLCFDQFGVVWCDGQSDWQAAPDRKFTFS